MIDTTGKFLAINSIRKNEKEKPSKSNIYQHLQKDEKHKELESEIFDQAIENILLSGTVFTKTDPDFFYILNDDIIIENFNDITLLRQDIHEKENKIRDLNHHFEVLSDISESKLNDINNQITSIHTALNNITSSHKAQIDCPKISSNQDIDQTKFLREDLKNKNTIINILLENIFSNNKNFSSYKKLEDNYKNNVKKMYLLKLATSQNDPKIAKTSSDDPKLAETNQSDPTFQNWENLKFCTSFHFSNFKPNHPSLDILGQNVLIF